MAMIRYGSYSGPVINDSDLAAKQLTMIRNAPHGTIINDQDKVPLVVKQIVHSPGYSHTET